MQTGTIRNQADYELAAKYTPGTLADALSFVMRSKAPGLPERQRVMLLEQAAKFFRLAIKNAKQLALIECMQHGPPPKK